MTTTSPLSRKTSPPAKGAKAQASKESIIAAARSCFAAKGLFNSSMDDIQTAANISRGSLYYHFKSKDEIIKTVIEQNLGLMALRVEAIVSESHEKHSLFEDILIELTSFAEQITFGPGRGMAFHVWSYAMINEEIKVIMMEYFNRIQSSLEQVVKALQRQGQIPKKIKAKDAATALFGLVIPGFTVQRSFMSDRSIDAKTYIKVICAFFNT